ncbi:cobalt ABC transporter permease [Pseudovibrio exalbescens]|uniref:cobalt ABC transporter permease n=1 Tax=Pseudovibrio exalbescens TaxID=197461 RepID=UPI0023659157|nr:cobalt ABC transporter permease [Pseudovibrio exalbescens]MDD7911013.1 cobalt ABC transporter permease [Pseudovibrio exalbescens]
MKHFATAVFVLFACLSWHSTPAEAHKVITSVFVSGSAIEGEVGFSNGDMAAGALVEVFDDNGTKLGETTTDEEGFFTYVPTAKVPHIFKANLGQGHVAQAELPADDVPFDRGGSNALSWAEKPGLASDTTASPSGAEVAPAASPAAEQTAFTAQPSFDLAAFEEAQRKMIAEAVRKEVRPLQRELIAYKEKTDLQTVLGGIGYILGIFGVGFYIAARRKLKETT